MRPWQEVLRKASELSITLSNNASPQYNFEKNIRQTKIEDSYTK